MSDFKIPDGMQLEEAINTALGYASVCWENPGGAGTFDSTKAAQCGRELAAAIRDGRVRDGDVKTQVSRWVPLDAQGRVREHHEALSDDPPAPTDR